MRIMRLTLGWMLAVSSLGCATAKDAESPKRPGGQTGTEQVVEAEGEAEAEVDGENESSSQSESQSEEGD